MSLKFEVAADEFEILDEGLRDFYEESDNGYRLKVEGIPEPEDTSGLKSALEKEREARKENERKAREAERKAQEREKQRAKEENDFKSLYESSEAERERLAQEYEQTRKQIATEKRQATAMQIAGELADGPNAKVLSRFIADRIDYQDGEVRVLDEKGNPTVSKVDDLKKEFEANEDFKSLLRGNKAAGGGAAPAGHSGGTAKRGDLSGDKKDRASYFANKFNLEK